MASILHGSTIMEKFSQRLVDSGYQLIPNYTRASTPTNSWPSNRSPNIGGTLFAPFFATDSTEGRLYGPPPPPADLRLISSGHSLMRRTTPFAASSQWTPWGAPKRWIIRREKLMNFCSPSRVRSLTGKYCFGGTEKEFTSSRLTHPKNRNFPVNNMNAMELRYENQI
jgi:hypothetical protein